MTIGKELKLTDSNSGYYTLSGRNKNNRENCDAQDLKYVSDITVIER